ncbi:MAG: hypothetical protein RIS80_1045, partial [Actinomycetota bacterium]
MAYADREKLAALFEQEVELFQRNHPRSRERHDKAQGPMMSGVPMSWMAKWP